MYLVLNFDSAQHLYLGPPAGAAADADAEHGLGRSWEEGRSHFQLGPGHGGEEACAGQPSCDSDKDSETSARRKAL